MTETETKRNHECSYNKYYNMPSREELHRCYGGYLSESDFTTARGRNQNKSRIAEKIVADWAVDRQCEKNMQASSLMLYERSYPYINSLYLIYNFVFYIQMNMWLITYVKNDLTLLLRHNIIL